MSVLFACAMSGGVYLVHFCTGPDENWRKHRKRVMLVCLMVLLCVMAMAGLEPQWHALNEFGGYP